MVFCVIEFRLDPASGRAVYLQLTHQVRQALRMGRLRAGDQLPTAREVGARLGITSNTVLKAYRELELRGLVVGRTGVGTFVVDPLPGGAVEVPPQLRHDLERWLAEARAAGLDEESVDALLATTRDQLATESVA